MTRDDVAQSCWRCLELKHRSRRVLWVALVIAGVGAITSLWWRPRAPAQRASSLTSEQALELVRAAQRATGCFTVAGSFRECRAGTFGTELASSQLVASDLEVVRAFFGVARIEPCAEGQDRITVDGQMVSWPEDDAKGGTKPRTTLSAALSGACVSSVEQRSIEYTAGQHSPLTDSCLLLWPGVFFESLASNPAPGLRIDLIEPSGSEGRVTVILSTDRETFGRFLWERWEIDLQTKQPITVNWCHTDFRGSMLAPPNKDGELVRALSITPIPCDGDR